MYDSGLSRYYWIMLLSENFNIGDLYYHQVINTSNHKEKKEK